MRLFPSEDNLVSLWAARSLSAVFGALSIPAIYALSWLTFRFLINSKILSINWLTVRQNTYISHG
jgi:uncharacterized membrane protein